MAPKLTGKARKALIFGLGGLVAVSAGAMQIQQMRVEREVLPLADKHLAEYVSSEFEAVSNVTVSRDNVLFGTPRAKIEVFVRPSESEGNEGILGIEYNYVLKDGEWRFSDSGACSGEACIVRGVKAFKHVAHGTPQATSLDQGSAAKPENL